MDCPHCRNGEAMLHFDAENDRCRIQCGGWMGRTPCGWHQGWMTIAEGEALLAVAADALRGTVLTIIDRANAIQDAA